MVWSRIAIGATLIVSNLSAQQALQGRLTLKVTDATGAFVADARINVIDTADSDRRLSTKSDESGQATLDLAPGTYILRIRARGFDQLEQKNIDVRSGSNQHFAFALRIATSCPPGCAPIIDDSATRVPATPYIVNAAISEEPLRALPLIPRRVKRLRRGPIVADPSN